MRDNVIIVFFAVALLAFIAFKIVWSVFIIPIYEPLLGLEKEGIGLYRDLIIGGEFWVELAFSIITGAGAALTVYYRKRS
jgi:ABC-type transport system involved in cytochrome c biogenesis permease component